MSLRAKVLSEPGWGIAWREDKARPATKGGRAAAMPGNFATRELAETHLKRLGFDHFLHAVPIGLEVE